MGEWSFITINSLNLRLSSEIDAFEKKAKKKAPPAGEQQPEDELAPADDNRHKSPSLTTDGGIPEESVEISL